MINPPVDIIRQLADFILLNAYSVNSSGFGEGKAGHSLCLFELSAYLQNERMEDHAFDLLQEALLIKSTDISFEYGISGVGFVLLYLINNHFIDAEFDELFGEKRNNINTYTEILLRKQSDLTSHLRLTDYFIELCRTQDVDSTKEKKLVSELVNGCLKELEKKSAHLSVRSGVLSKSEWLSNYLLLLRACYLSAGNGMSDSYDMHSLYRVQEIYLRLYENHLFKSDYLIGFYLSGLAQRNRSLNRVASLNKERFLAGIVPESMTLKQLTDLAVHLFQDPQYKDRIDEFSEFLTGTNKVTFERKLLSLINSGDKKHSFSTGISRLLLFYTATETRNERIMNLFI